MSYPYKITPRPYQRRGCIDAYKRKRYYFALDMGLGKTKIALDFVGVLHYFHKVARSLILCPLNVIPVWEDEIEKNWPDKLIDMGYTVLRPGSHKDRWKRSSVVITNYDYAKRVIQELMEWAPDVVILDESHKIKNPHARQSKIAHRLGAICRYAICLSGTPIGNRPFDLWSQFKFLVPDLCVENKLEQNFTDFKNRYGCAKGFGGFEFKKFRDLPKVARLIKPYVKSAKSGDYLTLPKTNFIEVPVEMGEKARKLYAQMEKEFVAEVNEMTTISAPIVLAKLTKLSQISGGFIRDTETEIDHPVHRAKLEVLKGICEDLVDQGTKRVVIFARFLWEIEQIRKTLTECAPDWTIYEVSGRIKTEGERKLAQSMFTQDGGAMICQIATGSVGLNLQAANYCIFYSLDYSFINFAQAIKRIHRPGQTLPCFFYLLLCKATLDRRIYSILKGKRSIADEVMNMVKEMKG